MSNLNLDGVFKLTEMQQALFQAEETLESVETLLRSTADRLRDWKAIYREVSIDDDYAQEEKNEILSDIDHHIRDDKQSLYELIELRMSTRETQRGIQVYLEEEKA